MSIETVIAEHVQLKSSGSKLTGLCPFHSEKTPSFTVNPATQQWHCFGCADGGSEQDFLRRIARAHVKENG